MLYVEDNMKGTKRPDLQTKLFLYSNVRNLHVEKGCFFPVYFVSICNVISLIDEMATKVSR
jgi:hypothetical protein